MDVRLALCLLWALLATASARPSSCYRRLHGQSSQVERRCRFWEDSCITVQEENSYDGSVHRGVFQSCINSLMSLEGQMDFEFGDGIYLRVRSELCRETNCNTGELKDRPKLSTVPNGRQCPSCYALGSHRCLQDDTLRCQGAANQCVDVVGTLLESEFPIGRPPGQTCSAKPAQETPGPASGHWTKPPHPRAGDRLQGPWAGIG
ncbi:phospholipase A2 inhibitor and Ly6/PLAUR domain-containing protein-like, partial [Chelydra serpentina]